MLNDLAKLIEIPSVMDSPKPNAPFGEKVREALDCFLDMGKNYGLKTEELDGYCGFAEYGSGKDLIGILCHLDVVPSGSGWTNNPFKLVNEDGMLYGRGVVDNKGAAVACLHVLKKLKENNIQLKNRIRLIVGCNEENGSACMKYYHAHGEIPKLSIVPDADFPIINSEKGILQLEFAIPLDDFFKKNILSLSGGERANVVPGEASLTVKKDSPLYNEFSKITADKFDNSLFTSSPIFEAILTDIYQVKDFSIENFGGGITVGAKGISAHSMCPQEGKNAIWKIFTLLNAFNGAYKSSVVSTIYKFVCNANAPERLGIDDQDSMSGAQTINMGKILLSENTLYLTLDCRCPLTSNIEKIKQKVLDVMPADTSLKQLYYAPNLFIDENSILIKTLLKVYHTVTGNPAYTVKTGGGTYARELPNAVAFGPTFPNSINNIHNVDECVSVEEFYKLSDIYYAAILALDKI